MKRDLMAILGVISPVFGFICVLISVAASPWFSWNTNAISDLGHSLKSEVSPILNSGLLITGLMLLLYAFSILKREAKWSSCFLMLAGFGLQLVATFNEVYETIHLVVSIYFFVTLTIATVLYAFERRSGLAMTAFTVILASWLLYWGRVFNTGIAVPEIISSAAASSWIVNSALNFLRADYSNEST
jgi:hypothetical membrane protein